MMIFFKPTQVFFLLLTISSSAFAHLPPKSKSPPSQSTAALFRSDCAPAQATTVLEINNVRARLSTAGDSWWNGGYVVPATSPGSTEPPVTAIFAGSLWLGGIDEGGNLKMAAQTYGHESGKEEFWPGPLNEQGTTATESCSNWDRFFKVNKGSVAIFRANWDIAISEGRTVLEEEEIPDEIKGWPALGNPFFEEIHGFELPGQDQENPLLADFWEVGGSPGKYEPQFGDFPILRIPNCHFSIPIPSPDEMIFSITNDAGGLHTNSSGDPIHAEIHTTAFAYKTADEINDMTFYQYRLINRGFESLKDAYTGIWMDADLGCFSDDYVGCDPDRDLGYVYNADDLDGEMACDDCEGVATYCTQIPVLGLDFLRSPLDHAGTELGMSSFTYSGSNVLPSPQPDFNALGAYNILSGKWPDGTPMTQGGSGYDLNSTDITNYAFPDPPNKPMGWSMCQENAPYGDQRTTQATGPFLLKPGGITHLVAGLIWVPNLSYPCPNLSRFFEADDKAQALFNNCFDVATSIKETVETKIPAIKIYPNPYALSSNDKLHLENLPNNSKVSIFDIKGCLLWQGKEESVEQIYPLQEIKPLLNPGIYFLQIQTIGLRPATYKLIILA